MSLNEQFLKESYHKEQRNATLKAGKLFSAITICFFWIYAFYELAVYHSLPFFLARLLVLIPAGLFLALATSNLFTRYQRLIIPLHIVTLIGSCLMMLSIAWLRLQQPDFFSNSHFIILLGELMTMSFWLYVAAAGAGKILPYLMTLSLVAFLGLAHLAPFWSWNKPLLLAPALFTYLVAIVFSIHQEKTRYREFILRKTSEYTKEILEHEIKKRKTLEEQLKRQAIRDELTNLYNRRIAFSILRKQIALASKNSTPLTVCFIDIDKLKQINDSLGHSEGDTLLITTARYLRDNIEETDLICRIGGDEFLIIFPGYAEDVVEGIVGRVHHNLFSEYHIDFSYGCAEHSKDNPLEASLLIEKADARMYQQKIGKHQAEAKGNSRN